MSNQFRTAVTTRFIYLFISYSLIALIVTAEKPHRWKYRAVARVKSEVHGLFSLPKNYRTIAASEVRK